MPRHGCGNIGVRMIAIIRTPHRVFPGRNAGASLKHQVPPGPDNRQRCLPRQKCRGLIEAAPHPTCCPSAIQRRTECSLSKYGFRASGVRTGASADRAETGLRPRFLSSVPKRPSQEVRRELASRERFSAVSATGQSTGLPRKPQETCHSARRPVRRRARLVWELADRVRPDSNGLR